MRCTPQLKAHPPWREHDSLTPVLGGQIALPLHSKQQDVRGVEERAVPVSLKEPRGGVCKMLRVLLLVTVQMLRVNQSLLYPSPGKFTRHSVTLTPCFIAGTETNVVDEYFVFLLKNRGQETYSAFLFIIIPWIDEDTSIS